MYFPHFALQVVIPLVVAGARIYGKVFNTFEMEGGDDLHKYIHNRLPGQALITVCNHTSVVDEPVLFACMLKAETVLKPHTVRLLAVLPSRTLLSRRVHTRDHTPRGYTLDA